MFVRSARSGARLEASLIGSRYKSRSGTSAALGFISASRFNQKADGAFGLTFAEASTGLAIASAANGLKILAAVHARISDR